jgi:hypothetical protein
MKLTPEEEIEAQAYIDANGDTDKVLAKKIHNTYKDHRKPKPGLIDMVEYTKKVKGGQVPGMDEAKLLHCTDLDRPWTEGWLDGIAAGTHSRLHNHRFSYAN